MWEPGFADYFDTIAAKYTKNLDHNSGDPIGMSVCQIGASNGRRTTASDAFLSTVLANLTILTNATVERILFEGQKAVGVEIAGKRCQAPPFHCLQ